MVEKVEHNLEIRYCVSWGYFSQAAWIAAEFFVDFGKTMGFTLTPVGEGRLEVYLDGETIFDRKQENGAYPALDRVRQMKKLARDKVAAVSLP